MEERTRPTYTLEAALWDGISAAAQSIAEPEIRRPEPKSRKLIWANVITGGRDPADWKLLETLGFHELEIEDALSEGERPHLEQSENHLFLTAPVARMEGPKVYFTELAIFSASGFFVTVSAEPCALVETLMERWKAKPGAVAKSSPQLLHALLDAVVDGYFPIIDALEDQGETLESEVFKGKLVPVKDLLRLKRRLLEMRRRLTPLRDILNGLLRREVTTIGPSLRPYFQDVYDHTLRVLEHLDVNRDILASILEAHLSNVSNRLNGTMQALTVIATALMTVSLFTGWYGMNFKHMPELDWPAAYPLLFCAVVLAVAGELWWFRKKGWF